MKKFSFVAVVAVLMILTGSARATTLQELGLNQPSDINLQEPADVMSKMPGLKQGVAFSIDDSKINYLSTIDIAKFKGFNLECGVATDAEKTGIKAVAVLSYDLFNAKKAGIDIPVLDLIDVRPGLWIGYGRIEGFQDGQLKGEGSFGFSLSAVNLKF
jgi:hypothetical protein